MFALKLIVFSLLKFNFLFISIVNCENIAYYNNSSRSIDLIENEIFAAIKRSPRLFSFETLDDDLKIGVEFSVPFISIPVKATEDTASNLSKGLVNINLTSVLISGIFVLLAASLGSAFANKKEINFRENESKQEEDILSPFLRQLRFTSNSNEMGSGTTLFEIMEKLDEFSQKYGLDVNACFQKLICLFVRKSSIDVKHGRGTSFQKIIDGIMSLDWILGKLHGTAIKHAIDLGKRRFSCENEYRTCKLNEESMLDIISANFV